MRRLGFVVLFFLFCFSPVFADVSSTVIDTASHVFLGVNSGDKSGSTVINCGDVNGDGFDDFLVGAQGASQTKGTAYLVLGNPTLNYGTSYSLSDTASSFLGNSDSAYVGDVMCSKGDLNGDGYPDFVFALYHLNKIEIFLGKKTVYGHKMLVESTSQTIELSKSSILFGKSISMAGDVNGDGYSDLIMGAPKANTNSLTNNGVSYLYYGKSTITGNISNVTTFIAFNGEKNNDQSGYKVAIIPDINRDGFDDILIGSYPSEGGNGKVYLIYGKRDTFTAMSLSSADAVFTSDSAIGFLGTEFVGLGDINGDGYGDFAIGDHGAGSNYQGKIYIYFGKNENFASQNSVASANLILTGKEARENAGEGAIASAGDVNGDLCNDLIIGSYQNSIYQGKVYVIYGGASLPTSSEYTLSSVANKIYIGQNSEDRAGTSVSSAGDINHDGIDEFLIGVPFFSSSVDKPRNGKSVLFQLEQNTTPSVFTSISILDENLAAITTVKNRQKLTVQMIANDPDATKRNVAFAQAYSTTYATTINIRLLETTVSSGIYRGFLYLVRSRSNGPLRQLSAALNDTIHVTFSGVTSNGPTVINAAPFVRDITPVQDGIGSNTKVRLDYYLCDYDLDKCNFTTAASQVQYKKSTDTTWTDATLLGKTSQITSLENGMAHNASFEALYIPIGNVDGSYDFRLKPHDGNQYADSYTQTTTSLYIDNTPPAAPVLNEPLAQNFAYEVTVSGSAQANSTVRIYVGNSLASITTVGSNGSFSAFPITVSSVNYTITAVCVDDVGNISATSNAIQIHLASSVKTITSGDLIAQIQFPFDSLSFEGTPSLTKIPTETLKTENGNPPTYYQYLSGFEIKFAENTTVNAQGSILVSVTIPTEVRVTSAVLVYVITNNNTQWTTEGITLNSVVIANQKTTISFYPSHFARFMIGDPIDPYPPVIRSVQLDQTDIVTNNYYSSTPTISISVSDADSGIATCSVLLQDTRITTPFFSYTTGNLSVKEGIFYVTANRTLIDGTYYLVVTVWDHSLYSCTVTSAPFIISKNTFYFLALHAPNPFNPKRDRALIIGYNQNKAAEIRCYILNQAGDVVYENSFSDTSVEGSAGYHQLEWDGKNKSGQLVPNGLYYAYLTAKSGPDSRRVKLKIAVLCTN